MDRHVQMKREVESITNLFRKINMVTQDVKDPTYNTPEEEINSLTKDEIIEVNKRYYADVYSILKDAAVKFISGAGMKAIKNEVLNKIFSPSNSARIAFAVGNTGTAIIFVGLVEGGYRVYCIHQESKKRMEELNSMLKSYKDQEEQTKIFIEMCKANLEETRVKIETNNHKIAESIRNQQKLQKETEFYEQEIAKNKRCYIY